MEKTLSHTCMSAALLAGLGLAGSAGAQTPPPPEDANGREQIMVVLDASGSMWGQVDGVTKIEIVREAFGRMAGGWDGRPVDAGLIAYGHRRKGDCSDIEVMAAPAAMAPGDLGAIVDALTPTGMTPLGDAVRLAAEELKYTERKATVILLSDGVETCGVDPCQLGRELESLGVDFTANVVGFDISSEEEKAQLACLAENTGGRFVTADNAAELDDALTRTSAAAVDPAPEPEGLKIQAVLADTGEVAGATHWVLEGQGETYEIDGESATLDLLRWQTTELGPGPYTITGFYEDFAGAANFELPAGQDLITVELHRDVPETMLTVLGEPAAGGEFQVEWIGAGGADDRIAVVATGAGYSGENFSNAPVTDGNPVTIGAPGEPGAYDLIYVHDAYGLNRIDARQAITVADTAFRFEPLGPIRAGGPFQVRWTGPGLEPDMIAIGPRTGGSSDYSAMTWLNRGNPASLNAPSEPGEYELRYYGAGYELLYVQPITVQ